MFVEVQINVDVEHFFIYLCRLKKVELGLFYFSRWKNVEGGGWGALFVRCLWFLGGLKFGRLWILELNRALHIAWSQTILSITLLKIMPREGEVGWGPCWKRHGPWSRGDKGWCADPHRNNREEDRALQDEDQTGNGFYIVSHIFDLRSLQVCQQLKCGGAIDLTGCLV